MSRTFSVVMMCAAAVLLFHATAGAAVVNFPDAGLDQAVRAAIGKPGGDILTTDLVGAGFVALIANRANITNLAGLEHCTDLTTLSLVGNQISDLRPLSGLAQLSMLFLKENAISDLGPLEALHGMHTLSLDDNQITVLTPLSGMAGLTNLYLNGNQIADLAPLAGLSSLLLLHLSLNAITNLSALSGLNNLADLELVSNQLTSVAPLLQCAGLGAGDNISLSGNALTQDAICNEVPVLQSRGAIVTFDGICGIVPGDCNVFWTFATEMNTFASVAGANFSLPAEFREWDLENWPHTPTGDGIPDLWQLQLLADVYCTERHRLHELVVTTFQANLDALIAETLDSSLNYWTVGMMCLSTEALEAVCALRGLDSSRYTPCREMPKAAGEPFSASGDCDGDGESNLDEYTYVRSLGGNANDYVQAAGEDSPFWRNNPALPAMGVVGRVLCVAGILLFVFLRNSSVRRA